MTRSMDEVLRETIRDLAAESGPAPGLAAASLTRGRRLRRRRRTMTVAAALLLTVTATIPYAILQRGKQDDRPAPTVSTPAPITPSPVVVPAPKFSTTEPFRVPGGLVVTGIGRSEGGRNLVLDRATGRYRELPKAFIGGDPAPNGRYVISDYLGREDLALLDLRTGKTRWIPVDGPPEPAWSPTGDRLVVFRHQGFTLIDPATGRRTDHRLPDDQTLCIDYCRYTWLSDGGEVALPQAWARNAEPPQLSGLAIFNTQTGALQRNLPVQGAPLPGNAWSPTHQTVLTRPVVPDTDQVLITSTTDGRPTGGLRAETACYLPDGTILGRLGPVVTHYTPQGHPLESMTLPPPLAQKPLHFGPA